MTISCDPHDVSPEMKCFKPGCKKTFKQFQVQDVVEIPDTKPDIEQVLRSGARVVITNKNLVQTPKGVSCEGQVLTGRKLVLEGSVAISIEYVADERSQSVHAAHFNIPFSTYVVLDIRRCFDLGTSILTYIEDVFVEKISSRELFCNVLILIDIKSCLEFV